MQAERERIERSKKKMSDKKSTSNIIRRHNLKQSEWKMRGNIYITNAFYTRIDIFLWENKCRVNAFDPLSMQMCLTLSISLQFYIWLRVYILMHDEEEKSVVCGKKSKQRKIYVSRVLTLTVKFLLLECIV